tara:strand:+ start:106 stop:276 length:171 start_codon:yes stop_codon:yes gene_type:complete
MMKVLVTSLAKFIEFDLSKFIFEKRFKIIGFVNITDCYFSQLKKDALKKIKKVNNF